MYIYGAEECMTKVVYMTNVGLTSAHPSYTQYEE